MNQQQWEIIRDDIIKFNRLIHSPAFRDTEEYVNLCYDITQEEFDEQNDAFIEMWNNTSVTCDSCLTPNTLYVDGLADTVVTATQLVDAITPSQLKWGYIKPFLTKEKTTDGIKNYLLSLIVESILDAEFYGIDIVGAMGEVSRSNFSKVPTLKSVMEMYGVCPIVACDAAADWIQSNLEGYTITWEHIVDLDGVARVVFKDQNGKVRKPWCFFEPDLTKYRGV
jgi:hypothetical protein